ncbi:MAG TPA: MFS transporter, partial [Pseudonocardiaceae bacterium]|nr:MFS transporter [Pseudonocardiaceae bacterium]
AIQGLGGAFLFPATLALVNTSFGDGAPRFRALSVWAAAGASGMVVGSILGGVLTQVFGWQAVFFVNVLLAGVAALLAFPLITADGPRTTGRKFDLPGALTATIGATLVVFTLIQGPAVGWSSPVVVAGAVAGLLLLLAFVLVEARSADPLMPLRLLRNRDLSTGMAVASVFMATFGTLLYFLTVYFQIVHGYNALRTGLAYVAPMAAGFVGSMLGGRLAARHGVRPTLIASLVVGALAVLALGLSMSPSASYLAVMPALVVLNLPQGVVFTTMFAASATGVDGAEQGVAGGMVSTGQQVGYAVGLAILVAVANAGIGRGLTGEALRVATANGLRTAVFVATAGIALTTLVALNFRRAPARTTATDAQPDKVYQ